jgi:aspartate/methionine/tyrosine aminotransferase
LIDFIALKAHMAEILLTKDEEKPKTQVSLSSRSLPFLKPNPRFYYTRLQVAAIANEYHPGTNPDGALPLAVAENKLNASSLLAYINRTSRYQDDIAHYTWSSGMPRVRDVFAKFLSKYLFDGHVVSPDELVLCPGCVSILHQLSILLFEAGDSVLIPTPYYPAFDHDFWNMGNVIAVEVNNEVLDRNHVDYGIHVASLEAAYQRERERGRSVKGLLLTNPSNPLGIIYSDEEIRAAISWARGKGIHIIMDEIYALSVFAVADRGFRSAMSLLNGNIGNDIHILWGLSKDFGASGLRCGVCFSQNKELIRAMSSLNDAFMMSNLMQECAATLLADYSFVDEFMILSRASLCKSYLFLCEALQRVDVPIVEGGAAIFVFANFRKYLRDDSFEGERGLHEELSKRGVVLTPGYSCHAQVPGYFRICFAWIPYTSLEEAVRRISAFAQDFNEQNNG